MDLFSNINELMQQDNIKLAISGAIIGTFGGMGYTILNLLKSLPIKIYVFIKRRLITTITIRSDEIIYYKILDYLTKDLKANNASDYRITTQDARITSKTPYRQNMQEDDSNSYMLEFFQSYPYLLFYNRRPIFIKRYFSERSPMDTKPYEEIKITKIGKSQLLFKKLINSAIQSDLNKIVEKETFDIYKNGYDYFAKFRTDNKYNIDNFIINDELKDIIDTSVKDFLNNEDYYFDKGMNYNKGFIFHGPAGTGKSTISKYLAQKYKLDIYYLSIDDSERTSLEELAARMQKHSIVCIEDIDVSNLVIDRDKESKNINSSNNLQTLLNILDGVYSPYGVIFIITTNEIDKIDYAIKRPGRIDHIIELSYLNEETTIKFINKFFNGDIKLLEIDKLLDIINNNDITPAIFQNYLIKYSTSDTFNSNLNELINE